MRDNPKLLIRTWENEENNEGDFRGRILAFIGMIAFCFVFWFLVILASCQMAHADNINSLSASWYSEASLKAEGTWAKSGGIMANGRKFNENALTCAAGKQYKLGTRLLVTNLANGKAVLVVVTDRVGRRFYKTRIDLSKGAFLRLGSLSEGLIPVSVHRISINVKGA